eukprot:g4229.t1
MLLADPGSYEETEGNLFSANPLAFKGYEEKISGLREKTNMNDAVVTGRISISGKPAMIAVMDFKFFAGSMGSVVGEKITRAIELAIEEKRGMIIVSASSGARMQEGMLSLMQMAKTCGALARLGEAKLPYISVLTHPTTGGVTASFATIGDINIAEPKCMIGKRGHKIEVLNTLRLAIGLDQGDPDLYYHGKELPETDAILPRIGTSITRYGTAVVRQFEQMDIYTPNTAAGISNSRDKLRSLQILSRHDVGIPTTAYVDDKRDVEAALERVGGAPVIIKLLEGTQGVGVILADKIEIAKAIIETLQSSKQQVLLQKFVAESKGKDVRAFVIGDRVVAAIRRVAQGQEFRSNVHRGGKAEVIDLDPAYAEAAVRAAQIMGLRICGVDMLEGKDGPQIMEVNSSPGFEGIEGATGLDIAGEVIDYIADQVMFPEIDIRQRLTWVDFPEWDIKLKAKADTGAKSSAIDCAEIVELPGNRVRFTVRLDRKERKLVTLEEDIVLRKRVRSSTGHPTDRIFVETKLLLAGFEKKIIVSLVCRKRMIHRLLLGRGALGGDFLVDSSVDHWATPKKPRKGKG